MECSKNNIFLCAIVLVLNYSVLVKSTLLPSYISPCSASDPNLNKCIKNVAQSSLKELSGGIPELGVPPLDPAVLGKILANSNGLKIKFENSTLTGLGSGQINDVKLNLKKNTLKLDLLANITMKGKYNINGRILILPVVGEGEYTVHLKNLNLHIYYEITKKEIDGQTHWNMRLTNRIYRVEAASFDLENLFGGNKLLGATTLQFLNSNWEVIMREIAPPVVDQIMKLCLDVANKFYSKVPTSELLTP